MSDYGLNFGFRRSGGDAATREGRFRAPAGVVLRQGQLITIDTDPENEGFVKLAPAGAKIVPGVTGLAIQHDGWQTSEYEAPTVDSFGIGGIRPSHLLTIWSGYGEKIWLKNTPAQNRWDGRQIPARTVITATGLVVGDQLAWDGTKFIKAGEGVDAVASVTVTNGTDYAEAVLLA